MSPRENSTSSRTLALFFDGTMDEYSSTVGILWTTLTLKIFSNGSIFQNTNVVKLFSLLNKNSSKQLCYYQVSVLLRLALQYLIVTKNFQAGFGQLELRTHYICGH